MNIKSVRILPPRVPHFLASAEVVLEFDKRTVVMRDLRVLVNDRDETWIGLPTYPGENSRWDKTLEFDKKTYHEISAAVMLAFEEYSSKLGVKS
jgi:hypothetical protein